MDASRARNHPKPMTIFLGSLDVPFLVPIRTGKVQDQVFLPPFLRQRRIEDGHVVTLAELRCASAHARPETLNPLNGFGSPNFNFAGLPGSHYPRSLPPSLPPCLALSALSPSPSPFSFFLFCSWLLDAFFFCKVCSEGPSPQHRLAKARVKRTPPPFPTVCMPVCVPLCLDCLDGDMVLGLGFTV